MDYKQDNLIYSATSDEHLANIRKLKNTWIIWKQLLLDKCGGKKNITVKNPPEHLQFSFQLWLIYPYPIIISRFIIIPCLSHDGRTSK